MAARVRIGLIGCGGIMQFHMGNLSRLPAARVVALTEPSQANLDRFRQWFPATGELPAFADHREMLREVKMDGVIIGSPHTLHFEQIMDSLGRGLHVLVEKPMVCSVEHAKKAIARAKRKGRLLMIAYQRHYMAPYRGTREMIAQGKLGKVIFVSALQAQDWRRACKGTWRQNPDLSGGGQLNDSGSHLVDIILWMTGLVPQEVFAYEDNRGAEVDILSAVSVKFKGGAVANLSVVGDSPGWREDISLWGDQGVVYIRGSVPQGGFVYQGFASPPEDLSTKFQGAGSADENFVNSILGKEQPETPAICGLRVIQLTEAIWESARTGKPSKVTA